MNVGGPSQASNAAQWQQSVSAICKAVVATMPALMEMIGSAKSPGLASQLPQLWLALAALSLPTGDPAVALAPESTSSIGSVSDSAPFPHLHTKRSVSSDGSESGAAAGSSGHPSSPSIIVDGSSLWKLCENHQDGKTAAKWSCQACASLPLAMMLRGPVAVTPSGSAEALRPALLLCDECDGFMHLAPTQKLHNRELLRLGVTKVRPSAVIADVVSILTSALHGT